MKGNTPERYETFTDKIDAGKRAGNIDSSQPYITDSAGVDCSGFVGLCLGLREKHRSVDFVTCGHSVPFYSVDPGDILAKDGHVVLVAGVPSSISIPIYESTRATYATDTTVPINGVVYTHRPKVYFQTDGYVARRPYHDWVVSNNRVVCSSSTCTAVSGTVGDANGKYGINTGDATFVLNYTSGRFILTVQEKKRADVNGDGIVNTADATAILNLI